MTGVRRSKAGSVASWLEGAQVHFGSVLGDSPLRLVCRGQVYLKCTNRAGV